MHLRSERKKIQIFLELHFILSRETLQVSPSSKPAVSKATLHLLSTEFQSNGYPEFWQRQIKVQSSVTRSNYSETFFTNIIGCILKNVLHLKEAHRLID